MGSKTSRLKAYKPKRWGHKKVNIVFGHVRVAEYQDWIFEGDTIQHHDGSLWEFAYREGDVIKGYPVNPTCNIPTDRI
jgi:hypothetical protein